MNNNIQIQGPRGPQGNDGSRGLNGQSGVPGTRGERGSIGIKGESGSIGPSGSIGNKGETGEQGLSIKGEKGEIGNKGEIGDIAPFLEKIVPCFSFNFTTPKIGSINDVQEGCMLNMFGANILGNNNLNISFGINSEYIPFYSNPCNYPISVKSIGWSSGALSGNTIPSINTLTNNKVPIGIKLIPFRFNKFYYNGLERTNDILDQFSGGNYSRITYFGTDDNLKINQPFKGIKDTDKSDFVNYFVHDDDLNTKPNPYIISIKDNPGGCVEVDNMVLGVGEGIGMYFVSNNNVGATVGPYIYTELKGLSVSVYLEKY